MLQKGPLYYTKFLNMGMTPPRLNNVKKTALFSRDGFPKIGLETSKLAPKRAFPQHSLLLGENEWETA